MTELQWIPRAAPLRATAMLASADVALALQARLLRLDDDRLGALHGVATGDAIIVLGSEDRLPWVDGVEYLGIDEHAPRLLMPTAWQPAGHPALAGRALSRVATASAGPWAVVRRGCRLISTAAARPLARAHIRRWRPA